jgi:hypothetical protein
MALALHQARTPCVHRAQCRPAISKNIFIRNIINGASHMAKRTRAPARQRRATHKGGQRRATHKARRSGATEEMRQRRPRKTASRATGSIKKSRAKNTVRRASASPGAGKPPPPSARRHSYTPELLAAGRHRYEHTEESITSIAVDFGIHKSTLQRMAARLGWVRHAPAPRDLPPAVRLLAQAEALEDAARAMDRQALRTNGERPTPAEQTEGMVEHEHSADNQPIDPLPSFGEKIERLYRAALEELTAVEALRAQLKRRPHKALDGERTARTLSNLTETIKKLERMQCGNLQSGQDNNDDLPRDIDEFRNALARRIEAFVESRSDDGDAGDNPAVDVGPPQ